MSKLVFLKNKLYNYTEHLAIFMYIAAQWSIVGILLILISAMVGFDNVLISIIVFITQVIYSAYCLKRLFNLSIKGIILKTLLFLGIAIIFYIISNILFVVILYLTGGKEVFLEIQKAQQQSQ